MGEGENNQVNDYPFFKICRIINAMDDLEDSQVNIQGVKHIMPDPDEGFPLKTAFELNSSPGN